MVVEFHSEIWRAPYQAGDASCRGVGNTVFSIDPAGQLQVTPVPALLTPAQRMGRLSAPK
jgi:hypothetical protein